MSKFLSPAYQMPKIIKVNGINRGTGEGIFFGVSGNSLEFKSLIAGPNISIVDLGDELEINAIGVGEVNAGANLGTGEVVYAGKSGLNLLFKSIKAAGVVGLSSDANELTISSTAEANLGANLGTGTGIYASKSGATLQFKSLKATGSVSIANDANEITLGSTAENNSAVNLGTGLGLFTSKSGVNLQLKTLKAGANVTLTSSATEIEIASSGGGGSSGEANTSSSLGAGVSFVAPKSGVDLPFRSLLSSAGLTWSQQTDTVTASLHSSLISIAGLTTTANKGIHTTASNTYATHDLSVFGRSLIDDADASAARTTLELATSVTRDATTSATDTTSERLWRTNDLVKTVTAYSTTVGSMVKVGDYGWGIGQLLTSNANFNDYSTPGIYFFSSTGAVNGPVSSTGLLTVTAGSFSGNNTRVVQEYNAYAVQRKFVRNFNGTVWSGWDEYWSTVNFDPDLKANLNSPAFTGTPRLVGNSSGNANICIMGFYEVDGVTRKGFFGDAASGNSDIYLGSDAGEIQLFRQGSARFITDSTGSYLGGIPKVDTAAAGTNTTQIASTAFVAALGALKTNNTKTVTTRSATSYTFVLTDNVNIYNRFTNAGESSCTVPPNSLVPFPIGHVIPIRRAAAANLTLTPGSGVTLNAPSGGTLVMTNNMTAELIKVATDVWDVVGQTVAV